MTLSIWIDAIGRFIGGFGLFLLGMWLMTDGLKLAAGRALERILGTWTRSRARGLGAGILITAVVQSSSAVTVAAIGFVNAGLLTFHQAVWVLFGANVGTTMTGWLVALVGLNFKIEALALPLLGVGMLLRLTGGTSRRGALGTAIAGFGALFLGIDVLREAFAVLTPSVPVAPIERLGVLSAVAYVLVGVLLTTIMQSSSAALAVALTAAGGGFIPIDSAAAVVIGANIGTTTTAVLSAVGATSNARRAAGAHVMFNLLTGAVAVLLLPWFVSSIETLRDWLELEAAPETTLALFHTAFNVLGVLLMWPFADRMVEMLQSRFKTADEDEGRPRYLDANIAAVPTLALDALVLELRRIGTLSLRMATSAMSARAETRSSVAADKTIVDRLTTAVGEFTARLHRSTMSQESSERLPEMLRVARYYDSIGDIAFEIAGLHGHYSLTPPAEALVAPFEQDAERVFSLADTARDDFDLRVCEAELSSLEERYQAFKARLLHAGADGELPLLQMEILLQIASLARRGAQQAVKAARRLRPAAPEAAPAATPEPADEPQAT